MAPSSMFISKEGREGIEMPGGFEKCARCQIVFVTAQTDEDTVERITTSRSQGQPVLSKPVFRHTLASAVAAVTKH